jgi:hypothetical protein
MFMVNLEVENRVAVQQGFQFCVLARHAEAAM